MSIPQNTRKISPLTIWVNGESVIANCLILNNYAGYDFNSNVGYVNWIITILNENPTPEEIITPPNLPQISGILDLTQQVVNSWGQNDQVIFDYVALQLNLNLI